MKIDKIMIAGMDDKTSITDLEKLKEDFPFVEWGVLFSKHKIGSERYPSQNWINELCLSNTGNMSAHFCGAYPREILEEGKLNEVTQLHSSFDAIQLNYNFSRSKKWSWSNLDLLIHNCKQDVILQMNYSNQQIIKQIIYDPKIRYLHDASGGRGTEITNISNPAWYNYTGFAGGINENNIEKIISQVKKLSSEETCWLDLESGARDLSNQFSIKKVRNILTICEKHIS